ncbi:MAG TPA: ABC transporter permease [Planctomycetaceae bacterium]|jgi:putative ABC transport system permease protein
MLSLLDTFAKYGLIISKNVRRNLLRTMLTSLGTMVLVLVITLIWSVLHFLDQAMADRSSNFKAIITERWQIPSRMPLAYANTLREAAATGPDDVRPKDWCTWQFYGASIDPQKRDRDFSIIFFCMQPEKILTMTDELEDLRGARRDEVQRVVDKMQSQRNGVMIGVSVLKRLKKNVGDRMQLTSFSHKGIDLEVEIVGSPPPGTRHDTSCFMNADYFNAAFDDYKVRNKNQPHPMADKTLGLVWLRVDTKDEFQKMAAQIMNSPLYANPAVKCEAASSAVSTFLESLKDIFWAMRWLLAPAVLVTLSLVIANAISISVRERRMEIAVLKVLGFRPGHVLGLILGEAVLIGAASGLASAAAAYILVNKVFDGINFPIAFFSKFFIPIDAIGWGLAIGTLTALAGAVIPAWSARSVKVADVFSKVA